MTPTRQKNTKITGKFLKKLRKLGLRLGKKTRQNLGKLGSLDSLSPTNLVDMPRPVVAASCFPDGRRETTTLAPPVVVPRGIPSDGAVGHREAGRHTSRYVPCSVRSSRDDSNLQSYEKA